MRTRSDLEVCARATVHNEVKLKTEDRRMVSVRRRDYCSRQFVVLEASGGGLREKLMFAGATSRKV
jgi:hypothetical protein